MSGEMDLAALLRDMQPLLDAEPYGYGMIAAGVVPQEVAAFAVIVEAEGTTVVAPAEALQRAGIAHQGQWARISLNSPCANRASTSRWGPIICFRCKTSFLT